MLSNHELKKNARAQLGGKIFANYWLYMVLCCLVLAAMQSLGSLMCGIVYFIILGPLQVGFARILLNRARNKGSVELGHLFGNFSDNFSDCCILGIMITLFTFLWSLLLIVPGIIKSYAYLISALSAGCCSVRFAALWESFSLFRIGKWQGQTSTFP